MGDINLFKPKPIPEPELDPLAETIEEFLGLIKPLELEGVPIELIPTTGEGGAKLLVRLIGDSKGVILLPPPSEDGVGETGFLMGEIGRGKERKVEGGGGGNIAPEIDFDLGTSIALVDDDDEVEEGGIIEALGVVPVVVVLEDTLGEGAVLALADNLPGGGGATPTLEVDLIRAGEEVPFEEVTEDLPDIDNEVEGLTALDREGLEFGRVALLVLLDGREVEVESGRVVNVDETGLDSDALDIEGLDGVGD